MSGGSGGQLGMPALGEASDRGEELEEAGVTTGTASDIHLPDPPGEVLDRLDERCIGFGQVERHPAGGELGGLVARRHHR